jgi:general secretion pathway protein L
VKRAAIVSGDARELGGAAGDRLLLVVGPDGAIARWLLLAGGAVAARGDGADGWPATRPPLRTALSVPGEDVAIHWLDLEEGLAPAQAAAAARLLLGERSAAPIADMHVAVGGREAGLACVAMASGERMAAWLASARAAGAEPDLIVPAPLLLPCPETGLVRHGNDHRGEATAFALEPELARHIVGDGAVALDEEAAEAGLAEALAEPLVNLRQGDHARRRQLALAPGRVRRLVALALLLVALTLAVQVVTVLRLTFAADAAEEEAAALASTAPAAAAGGGWPLLSGALFDAIRATPNVELGRLRYTPEGRLQASVLADDAAVAAALRERLEGAGLIAEAGELRSAGGRPTVELEVRAR